MAYIDKYGVEYSDDRKTLVKCPEEFQGEYTIPNTVNTIGDSAFYQCVLLECIIIPSSVIEIGSYAFWNCKALKEITIPDSVECIFNHAFAQCHQLNSVIIGANVSFIDEAVFDCCYNLSSIIVNNENKVYDSRFNCNAIIEKECDKIVLGCSKTVIPYDVQSIGQHAFCGQKIASLYIPNNVCDIEDGAFENCLCLTHIVIPESVINIGKGAFNGCKNLAYCYIGKNVSYIGEIAFSGCKALSAIIVDSGNLTYDSRNNCNAIIETCTDRLIVGCKNTHIPENIKIIGAHAFCQNDIENVIIPARVTVIEECAFFSCSKLQYLTIHSDVLEIGTEAFGGCDNLEVVSIQSKEITFGSFAFANCPKLDILILHGNISMYDNVFTYDELLEIWLYVNTPPVIDAYDFEFADISGCTLYVPASTIDLYKKAVGWNEFKNIREISGK